MKINDDILQAWIFTAEWFTGIARMFSFENLKHHVALKRMESHTNITIDALPKSLEERLVLRPSLDELGFKKEITSCIEEFIEVIENNAPHIDLSNLYRNMKPQSIVVVTNFASALPSRIDKIIGQIYRGRLEILQDHIREAIFHELFHFTSYIVYANLKCCGFSRIKCIANGYGESYAIGIGLNEGYTQLLTERYFGDRGCALGYSMLTKIAQLIELILDKEDMERAYSVGDLLYVIDGLAKYSSQEDAIRILRMIDHILFGVHYHNGIYTLYGVKKTYMDLLLRLTKMYMKKIEATIETNDISSRPFLLSELSSFETILKARHDIGLLLPYGLTKKQSILIRNEIDKTLQNKKLTFNKMRKVS